MKSLILGLQKVCFFMRHPLTLVCLLCSVGRFFQKQPGTTELMGVGRFSDMVLEYKFSKNVFCKFGYLIVTPSMKPVFLVFFGRVGHVLQKQADRTQLIQQEGFWLFHCTLPYTAYFDCFFVNCSPYPFPSIDCQAFGETGFVVQKHAMSIIVHLVLVTKNCPTFLILTKNYPKKTRNAGFIEGATID